MRNIVDLRKYMFSDNMLDVGAGGEEIILNAISDQSVTALVYDKSEISHSKFKNISHIQWVQGDVRNLEFKDETFDCITMFCTLMYIREHQQKIKALKECVRVLKKGGYFYIWDFNITKESGLFCDQVEILLPRTDIPKTAGYGIKGGNLLQNFDDIRNYLMINTTIEEQKLENDFFVIVSKK